VCSEQGPYPRLTQDTIQNATTRAMKKNTVVGVCGKGEKKKKKKNCPLTHKGKERFSDTPCLQKKENQEPKTEVGQKVQRDGWDRNWGRGETEYKLGGRRKNVQAGPRKGKKDTQGQGF